MGGRFDTIDSYLLSLDAARRAFGEELRALIGGAVPEASEAIKYDMPAFQIGGRSFLYFAIWKKHAGLYPVYRRDAAFEARIGPYRAHKDTVQFGFALPLPRELIVDIARFQADAVG